MQSLGSKTAGRGTTRRLLCAPSNSASTRRKPMLVLGLETSCDETGVALYDSERGLLADALFSQIDLHRAYGGVVPELARSEEHTSELQSLMRISYAVFCLNKKNKHTHKQQT